MNPIVKNRPVSFRPDLLLSRMTLIMCIALMPISEQTCGLNEGTLPPVWLTQGAGAYYFTRPEPEANLADRFLARNKVLEALESAEFEIIVYCYGFDEPLLIRALARARERGVNILFTGSPERDYPELGAAGFTLQKRARSGLQHVKVLLVDRKIFFSGTGNFTRSGFFHNLNVFFRLELNPREARLITRALENENDRGLSLGNFRPDLKIALAPLRGRLIQARIVKKILSARYRIRFLIFSFTDPVINRALFYQAKRGILVEGIFDDPYGKGELAPTGQAALLNAHLGNLPALLYLEGNRAQFEKSPGEFHGGHLHHKTLIIDEDTVLTGSYNWSASARDKNLEIFFEITDPFAVLAFAAEFERIRERAALLPRPFFAPGQVSGPIPVSNFFPVPLSGALCLPADTPPRTGFTLFRGRGPYFQARFYAPPVDAPGQEPCLDWNDAHNLSAGLIGFRAPLVLPEPATEPEAKPGSISFEGLEYDLSQVQTDAGGDGGNLPCEIPERCEIAILTHLDPGAGFLETGSVSNPDWRSIRLLSLAGFSEARPLTRLTANFYQFEAWTPVSDTLVFLVDGSGNTSLACFRSGQALDRPLEYFLDYFEWRFGRRPECNFP